MIDTLAFLAILAIFSSILSMISTGPVSVWQRVEILFERGLKA